MSEPAMTPPPSVREAVCREIVSKCSSLRAAARLLPSLAGADCEEMLALMIQQAHGLARTLERHRGPARSE